MDRRYFLAAGIATFGLFPGSASATGKPNIIFTQDYPSDFLLVLFPEALREAPDLLFKVAEVLDPYIPHWTKPPIFHRLEFSSKVSEPRVVKDPFGDAAWRDSSI